MSSERNRVTARGEVHHAVQLLASFCGSALHPLPEDRHRSLRWDPVGRALTTATDPSGRRISLSFSPFALRVHRGPGGAPESSPVEIALRGRRLEDVRTELEGVLGTEGTPITLAPPEYDIPPRSGGDEAPLSPDPESLAALAGLYDEAHALLSDLAHRFGVPHHGVRCWPHHFDLAVLFEMGAGAADPRCTVGAGFSPGDEGRPEPYFYVTPYPYRFDAARREVPPAVWNVEGWLGLVMGPVDATPALLSRAVDACVDTLGLEVTPPTLSSGS